MTIKTINVNQISETSTHGITYIETDNSEAFIDFEECLQNYLDSRLVQDSFEYNKTQYSDFQLTYEEFQQSLMKYRIVGGRNILGNKNGFYESDPKNGKPYIVFYSEPRIAIECDDKQALYDFRYRLERLGWRTHDMT